MRNYLRESILRDAGAGVATPGVAQLLALAERGAVAVRWLPDKQRVEVVSRPAGHALTATDRDFLSRIFEPGPTRELNPHTLHTVLPEVVRAERHRVVADGLGRRPLRWLAWILYAVSTVSTLALAYMFFKAVGGDNGGGSVGALVAGVVVVPLLWVASAWASGLMRPTRAGRAWLAAITPADEPSLSELVGTGASLATWSGLTAATPPPWLSGLAWQPGGDNLNAVMSTVLSIRKSMLAPRAPSGGGGGGGGGP
ncbi:hypothetical protein GCM10009682_17200 [Luedemannella flava]|uniref:TIGR04222 domain-containing membrane protein n=1 Tax=Luedemannella flava TaxID=349316 RepID=A0ABN2LQK7_9ACTN